MPWLCGRLPSELDSTPNYLRYLRGRNKDTFSRTLKIFQEAKLRYYGTSLALALAFKESSYESFPPLWNLVANFSGDIGWVPDLSLGGDRPASPSVLFVAGLPDVSCQHHQNTQNSDPNRPPHSPTRQPKLSSKSTRDHTSVPPRCADLVKAKPQSSPRLPGAAWPDKTARAREVFQLLLALTTEQSHQQRAGLRSSGSVTHYGLGFGYNKEHIDERDFIEHQEHLLYDFMPLISLTTGPIEALCRHAVVELCSGQDASTIYPMGCGLSYEFQYPSTSADRDPVPKAPWLTRRWQGVFGWEIPASQPSVGYPIDS
ncbi:uncharacterized protein NECHADRAFT_78084 [Fusarium vanettenii 77-13-4]|uniref:Uncharacterized protein n=1 Tax=Fusarium vanettenii (strain ATCC MYA-4622 / CBS 123669 / FGSC 9596 / NRRL 45880 / 77-13-4) TaxID=660122 RepID=C7YN27_FUSV7|nr:uncharacterized protein NECHADRAFT_78084 [Fusarium vanettenii 77-13-4]EEU47549.1 predicted protein [Fusarium vanettenii 77-13-4]